MRLRVLIAGAFASGLVVTAPAFSRPLTTNPGSYKTVKVTLRDGSITVEPRVAVRGETAIFIITNRGTKAHTWVIGDITRGLGKNIGFGRTVQPGQQTTVPLFLDYRGLLPYYSPKSAGSARALKGIFRIL
jgi:hypothetical protein